MTSPATAPLPWPEPSASPSIRAFLRRMWGLMLRHIYLYLGSWPRLVEMMYWPTINILMFGFLSLNVLRSLTDAKILYGVMVAGVLLNETQVRVSQGMMMLFLEEIWSRNLGHLFASPMSFANYAAGVIGLGLMRTVISILPTVFIARYLFGFDLLTLGWPLALYFPLLIFNGWWMGTMVVSLLLRYGLSAEWLAWMGIWLLIPIMCPYYPVSVLPLPLQYVAWCLPGTYVFESMKSLIAGHGPAMHNLLIALGLNVAWFCAALLVFSKAWQSARKAGRLMQMGE